MNWAILGGAFLVFLLFSGVFSGAETGLYRTDRLRLTLRAEAGNPRAIRLAGLIVDEQSLLAVTLLGTNLMNYLATGTVALLLSHEWGVSDARTEVLTTLVVTPLIFAFGEVIPKSLFEHDPNRLMQRASVLLAAARGMFCATGAVWLLNGCSRQIMKLAPQARTAGRSLDARRRMTALLREAIGGEEFAEQTERIERVLGLAGIAVHTVMVPRHRVVAVAADSDRRDFVALAHRTVHARLPVYTDHPRHISGLVRVDELLADRDWSRVGERITAVINLRPHDTVTAAILRLQQARQPMAVVVDHQGEMVGLLTMKDLLEEVVGELAAW